MDDYSISSLTESQNEWCSRLVHILTPLIIDGFKSIFDEAWKLCKENDELDKYLMTFQNFIGRIPKWNSNMIQEERQRIIEKSGCGYLEELITCVHIIKLKSLTCIRVGQKQKKVNINVPSLDEFIHKVYINVARKLYTNVYLFEKNIAPLQIQKNNRELEIVVKECILLSIRDSIPVEDILRAYMDETQETDVEVEEQVEEIEKEVENVEDPTVKENLEDDNAKNSSEENVSVSVKERNENLKEAIKFSDVDIAFENNGLNKFIEAPKDIERLEQISSVNHERRKLEEADDDDDNEKIKIGSDISLADLDVHDIAHVKIKTNDDPLINFELLT